MGLEIQNVGMAQARGTDLFAGARRAKNRITLSQLD